MHAGFDIGGTTARGALFDREGTELAAEKRRVRGDRTPESVAELVGDMLEGLLASAGDDEAGELEAIGCGLAAQIDPETSRVRNSPNLGWRDVDFLSLVREALPSPHRDVPLVLANDLNAILLGEHTEGAVEDAEDVLAVYVGTGVGGAILSNGDIVHGDGGQAGEIGHSKVEVGGRLCGCGERGCVEAYAGGIHLERRVTRAAREYDIDELLEDEESQRDKLTVDLLEADHLAETREPLEAIWEEATDMLGLVVANACTLLNPSVLLLGGGILDHLPGYRRRLLSKISPSVLEVSRADLEIRTPRLGDRAGVFGAAELARERAR